MTRGDKGTIFVGTRGILVYSGYGANPRLYPEATPIFMGW